VWARTSSYALKNNHHWFHLPAALRAVYLAGIQVKKSSRFLRRFYPEAVALKQSLESGRQ